MLKKLKSNKKGFTLAELLIVIAIIGVMVAIAIPIFNSQLNKAKAGTDLANLRSAYAAAQVEVLTNTTASETTIKAAIDTALPDVKSALTANGEFKVETGAISNGQIDKTKITLGDKTMADLAALAK